MKKLLALSALVLLAACQREPDVRSSTIDVVTVRYFDGQENAALRKATDECAKYNRRARLRNASGSSSGDRDGIYDCLP
jgi:uncharacterized lipoprotein YajG